MHAEVDEVSGQIRPVDGEALLAPSVLAQITRVVLREVREREAHELRRHDEQRVNAGRDETNFPG